MDWKPRPYDIAWTENLLQTIKEGGAWGQPASCSSFVFYHSKKEYIVQDELCTNRDMVDRTKKVLGILGWKERNNDGSTESP